MTVDRQTRNPIFSVAYLGLLLCIGCSSSAASIEEPPSHGPVTFIVTHFDGKTLTVLPSVPGVLYCVAVSTVSSDGSEAGIYETAPGAAKDGFPTYRLSSSGTFEIDLQRLFVNFSSEYASSFHYQDKVEVMDFLFTSESLGSGTGEPYSSMVSVEFSFEYETDPIEYEGNPAIVEYSIDDPDHHLPR